MIVRLDLPIGVLAAQIVHAAGESGPAQPGTAAVVLAVPGEAELQQIAERLRAIPHVRVVEDAGPHEGQLMAIGCRPGPRKEVRRVLSALPLLR